jgi:CxxC-x17-CxxC domain-containing protein
MNFEDKILTCADCGNEFVFTAGEQEFYAEKGFSNTPKRCKECRQAKKSGGGARQMNETTCSRCGGVARVPFKITDPSRPVYCSSCYAELNPRD